MHFSTQAHAVITSFPIVTIVILVLVEFLKLDRSTVAPVRTVLCGLLAFSSLLAFFSGLITQHYSGATFDIPADALDSHFHAGRAAMVINLLCATFGIVGSWVSQSRVRVIQLYFAFLLLALIATVIAGQRGGILVYNYGAGLVLDASGSESSEH